MKVFILSERNCGVMYDIGWWIEVRSEWVTVRSVKEEKVGGVDKIVEKVDSRMLESCDVGG